LPVQIQDEPVLLPTMDLAEPTSTPELAPAEVLEEPIPQTEELAVPLSTPEPPPVVEETGQQ
jgi:hypothetical protein